MSTNLLPKGAWFGSHESLKIVIDMAMNIEAAIKSQGLPQLAFGEDEDEEELPRLLSIAGNTAVISITGSLVNNASFFNRFFGLTGYPEIKEALITAANDETIENIVLQIDSGGGTVSGVFELARFIGEVDSKIKPVESINTGMEASAAFLLGAQARKVHAQEMTQTGSIGVLIVHQEYSKFFKERGIETTVVRAGDHKALVNPFEPLTEVALKELQDTADYIHDKFIEAVADGRGMSFTNVKENMADGRIFFTEEAMRLGLVDNITSIDKLVAELNERQSGSTDGFGLQVGGQSSLIGLESSSTGDTDMAKKKPMLSKENQAKLSAGVPIEELDTSATDDESTETEASASEGNAELSEGTSSTEEMSAEGKKESTEKSEETTVSKDNSAGTTSLVSHLKERETELSAKVAELTLDLSSTKAELTTTQASTEGLEKIVMEACSRLSIGLGSSATDYTHLKGNALVEQYGSLNTQFCKRYPVGGVLADSVDKDSDKKVSLSHNRAKAVSAAQV